MSGRRDESQREVKEVDIEFRKAERSTTGSGVGFLLLGTGTAGVVVLCSLGVSKSASSELDKRNSHVGGVWI